MNRPIIKSGKFTAGADLRCGENVTIDVAEEVVVGDRCCLPDNAYFCGRRIVLGSDFYGYSHWNRRLEIGLGRIDDEFATLTVGSRATLHDNRIDLAAPVTLGDDVGLSPEVVIYTHTYWLPGLTKRLGVKIGSRVLVGFRSILLPGVGLSDDTVVGAGSVMLTGHWRSGVFGGNPAKWIKAVPTPTEQELRGAIHEAMAQYQESCEYRGLGNPFKWSWPDIWDSEGFRANVLTGGVVGPEDMATDDLREHLFKRGFRFFTNRPFRKMPRAVK